MSPTELRELINRTCMAHATAEARRLEAQAMDLIACGYSPAELVIRARPVPGSLYRKMDVVPASTIEPEGPQQGDN